MRKFSILAMLAVVLLFSACKSEKKEQEATTSETTTDNTAQTSSPAIQTLEFNGKTIPITVFYSKPQEGYNTHVIDSLVFEYEGKKHLINLNNLSEVYHLEYYSIEVTDYNFDDYMDIALPIAEGYCDIFLYNSQAKSFQRHEKLSANSNVSADAKTQTVTSSYGDLGDVGYTGWSEYKWIKGQLTLVRSVEESIDRDLNKHIRITKTLKDGKLEEKREVSDDGGETFYDDPADGQTYKIEKIGIGSQIWMAKNLNDPSKGGKCYLNNPGNCDKYGRLYTLEEAMKACPKGWYLPSKEDWNTLIAKAGGDKVAGKKLMAKSGWDDYEGKSNNGTDEYGFAALPGGYGTVDDSFTLGGKSGRWWGTTENNADGTYLLQPNYLGSYGEIYLGWDSGDLAGSYSVRCVKGDL